MVPVQLLDARLALVDRPDGTRPPPTPVVRRGVVNVLLPARACAARTWWMNRSWAGTSATSRRTASASLSFSSDRSHSVIWSSAPDAARTDSSVGCHSIDVIASVCHLNDAAALFLRRLGGSGGGWGGLEWNGRLGGN